MAFLNYSSEVISIPYIAYLIGRLVLTHERATPFVLEIDDYGVEFGIIASLYGQVERRT